MYIYFPVEIFPRRRERGEIHWFTYGYKSVNRVSPVAPVSIYVLPTARAQAQRSKATTVVAHIELDDIYMSQ